MSDTPTLIIDTSHDCAACRAQSSDFYDLPGGCSNCGAQFVVRSRKGDKPPLSVTCPSCEVSDYSWKRRALATPPVPAGEPRCPHGSWQGTYCPHCGGNRAVFGAQRGVPPLVPPVPAGANPVEKPIGSAVPAGDERDRLAALLDEKHIGCLGRIDGEDPKPGDDHRTHLYDADRLLAAGVRLTEGGNQ